MSIKYLLSGYNGSIPEHLRMEIQNHGYIENSKAPERWERLQVEIRKQDGFGLKRSAESWKTMKLNETLP